ncbi:DUF2927 domain-containing protein [Aliiroseovarius sp.]|uniref:DUF2927 domain-containing protein n=1 Tax=Aliiroseovarius sp. TaxID=1872442 RepID=UPI0026392AE3|nr:DUF2927 domain-containing protein [Aliiroseovarius sp.]
MRRLLIPALLTLAGCMQAPPGPVDRTAEVTTRRVATLTDALPPMKAFSATRIQAPSRPNRQIAADFLDLAFRLESGRALPVLTRFEGPVTLRVTGNAPGYLQVDLERLLRRLRVEAGIDIRQTASSAPAGINLQIIPKRQLQGLVPNAACFVAPNVASWQEYKRLRRSSATDWAQLTTRRRMAVFIPGDVSPQEMRDCLHEEIAQALGPVNDLYRLTDSVFNDDNFNTVLTGFDMLVLRAYYAPELSSGMTWAQVATRLPGILARLNPRGGTGVPTASYPTPQSWKQAIETALGADAGPARRRSAAQDAVYIARAQGWSDTRLAFSLYALGRLSLGVNTDVALQAFREAETIYRNSPGSDLQVAHMGVQLAAYALSAGKAQRAIEIVNTHVPAVMNAENAALLSTFLMIKAEALDLAGRRAEARLVRLDSLGWARYGFGSDAQVGQRLREIAAISPGT